MPDDRQPSAPTAASLGLAEFLGTFLLVFFGCGAVHASVLTSAQTGLWQVAIVWGLAIMIAIYTIGAISGAHINPAITFAFAAWGRVGWGRVPLYVISQLLGAFAAAAVLYALFSGLHIEQEKNLGIRRGSPGSELTAMCYGEFFPNPGGATEEGKFSMVKFRQMRSRFGQGQAFLAEVIGTAILAMVVFAVTDAKNSGAPAAGFAPVFIGLTVAALISVIAPLTQACFNPARDFSPRVFSSLAGWGSLPFTSNGIGWLTVYILAPTAGAWIGAGIYERLIRPGLPAGR